MDDLHQWQHHVFLFRGVKGELGKYMVLIIYFFIVKCRNVRKMLGSAVLVLCRSMVGL